MGGCGGGGGGLQGDPLPFPFHIFTTFYIEFKFTRFQTLFDQYFYDNFCQPSTIIISVHGLYIYIYMYTIYVKLFCWVSTPPPPLSFASHPYNIHKHQNLWNAIAVLCDSIYYMLWVFYYMLWFRHYMLWVCYYMLWFRHYMLWVCYYMLWFRHHMLWVCHFIIRFFFMITLLYYDHFFL